MERVAALVRRYVDSGRYPGTQLRPSASYPIRRELRAAVYGSLDD